MCINFELHAMIVDDEGRMYWSECEPVDFDGQTWDADWRVRDDENGSEVLKVPGLDQPVKIDNKCGSIAGIVWKAGFLMLEHIATDTSRLKDKRIIELGCGTGFLSIACDHLISQAGGTNHSIIATDLEYGLAVAKANVQQNGALHVQVQELQWGVTDTLTFETPDVVVMADVAYTQEGICLLADTLASLCGSQTVVLHAYTKRRYSGQFLELLEVRGFKHEEIARAHDVVYVKHSRS